MKSLLLIFSLILSVQPLAAQAQSACAQDYYCVCTFSGNVFLDEDVQSGGECQSRCLEESLYHQAAGEAYAGTYEFSCRTANGDPVSEKGDATAPSSLETVPLSTEEVHDPLIPVLNVPIPGLNFTDSVVFDPETGVVKNNLIGLYVTAIYRYLIGAAALISVTLVMIAGVQYATAGGNQDRITKAKNRMRNAIVGVIILLLVYNIAFLIDPRTVRFDSLSIRTISGVDLVPPGGEDDNVRATVPLDGNVVPLTGENILPPLDSLLDPDTLLALQGAAQDFYTNYQQNIVITSAYRPLEKQATMFYNNCLATGGICSVATCNPAGSSPVVAKSNGRYKLTGVLTGGGSPSVIINSIIQYSDYENCPHTSAVAVDAWCEGSGSYQADPACQQALIQTMVDHGFCRLSSEVWHFELNRKKVSTACSTGNSSIS